MSFRPVYLLVAASLAWLLGAGCSGSSSFSGSSGRGSEATGSESDAGKAVVTAPTAKKPAGTQLGTSLPPPPTVAAGNTSLTGDVRNALDKSPIPGATIQLVGGSSVQADANGHFVFASVPAGPVTLQATANGFTPDSYQANVVQGSPTTVYVVLSPELASGQLRFVLTWGQAPSDLDGHLTGPNGDGTQFHVYWNNKTALNVTQDRDDTQSFGPETITVTKDVDGHYTYFVFDYANGCPGFAMGGMLGTSQAAVKVYEGDKVIGSFAISAAAGSNLTWNVLTLDITNGVPKLTAVNSASMDTPGCQ